MAERQQLGAHGDLIEYHASRSNPKLKIYRFSVNQSNSRSFTRDMGRDYDQITERLREGVLSKDVPAGLQKHRESVRLHFSYQAWTAQKLSDLEKLVQSSAGVIVDQVRTSAGETQEDIAALRAELSRARSEAEAMRDLVSASYTARILFIGSGTAALGFIVSLVAWYEGGVLVIHPALAMLGLVVSCGFVVLAVWRSRSVS